MRINVQQRKVRHTLKDILVIVLFATLANADDWVEIALFAEDYTVICAKYIELKMGLRLMTQSVGLWG
ncbi:MAG: transposase family protein [Coprococcus sp.]